MGAISHKKLFAIRENILKVAGSEDLFLDLNRAVEGIIAGCDDGKMNRSFRREIIELISSIEMIKIRFLLGTVCAKDLHREAEFGLQQFRMRHQNFDYQVDPIFSAYFLIGPHSRRRQGRTAPRDKKGMHAGQIGMGGEVKLPAQQGGASRHGWFDRLTMTCQVLHA